MTTREIHADDERGDRLVVCELAHDDGHVLEFQLDGDVATIPAVDDLAVRRDDDRVRVVVAVSQRLAQTRTLVRVEDSEESCVLVHAKTSQRGRAETLLSADV